MIHTITLTDDDILTLQDWRSRMDRTYRCDHVHNRDTMRDTNLIDKILLQAQHAKIPDRDYCTRNPQFYCPHEHHPISRS